MRADHPRVLDHDGQIRQPASPRAVSLASRPVAATLVLLAVAGMLSGALWALRWDTTGQHAYPDSYWYTRQAAGFAGMSGPDAEVLAARTVCGHGHPVLDGWSTCQDGIRAYAGGFPERYNRILDTRPGYPLVAAPFVAVFHERGMTLATLMLGVLAGMFAALVVRQLGGSWVQSLAAVVLLYLLPTGFWISRLLAESGAVAAALATLCAVTALLRAPVGRARIRAAGLVAAGLFATTLMRPATGVLLAASIAGTAALVVIARSVRRRPEPALLTLLAVGAGVVVLWQLISLSVGLPGIHETLQDKYTDHFSVPDVPDPWTRLREQNRGYWPVRVEQWLNGGEPLAAAPVLAFLAGGVYVVSRVLPWRDALVWLAVGATGPATVAAHPLWTESDRLLVFVWLPPVVGLAMVGRVVNTGMSTTSRR
jgi:hypothetical protein